MGIVPGFEFDIFISYAHVDNLSIAEEDKGWVTDLHSTLNVKLWQEFGKKPSIWRDTSDLDGRMADPSIAPAIHNSAVFVAVMSTAYMQSPYCQKEVGEFCTYRHPAFELIVRGHSRSVVVVYGDVPAGDWREELRNVPTVRFCETDEATGARLLYQKPKRADPDPYWERLDLTIRHVAAILREMQRGPTTGTEIVSAGDGLRQQLPVYLAEATDDLQTERSEVFQVLDRGSKRAGVSMEPSRSIIEAVSVRQACRDGLARANASVHLINATPGRVWGDAGKPLAQMELEEALQRAAKPRPLVWISPDLKLEGVKDPDYRTFLQQLKAGKLEVRAPEVRTPEVFEMPFDRFVGQIENRLFPPVKAVWQEARQKQPGGTLVYISYKTAGPLAKLIDCLRDRKCAVAHLDHGTGGVDVQQRHEANLRFCDGLLVLYSHLDVSWAEYIAHEARMLARERHRPKKLGVLNEDPPPEQAFGIIDDLVMPVRMEGQTQCESLDDFLAAIEKEGNV